MIWVILFFIIILISSVLAYRSMRDYEEFPENLTLNSLYYIGNSTALNFQTLSKLHDLFLEERHFFTLEKLIKGKEIARVLYGPRDMSKNFPELNLVEIEDYLAGQSGYPSTDSSQKRVNVDQVLSWLVESKNNAKKLLNIDNAFLNLNLNEDQKVFIQTVLMPIEKSGENLFQSTLRIMVSDSDAIKRIELAKRINQIFQTATGLSKHEDSFPENKKYDSFKQRSLIPKEVEEFLLTNNEVIALIS